MIINHKGKKLLLPFAKENCWYLRRYNCELKFFYVCAPRKNSYSWNYLLICSECGAVFSGNPYRWDGKITCPKCHNIYSGNYQKEHNAVVLNCLVGPACVRKDTVKFTLYEFVKNEKTGEYEPEPFYHIRYSKENGLELQPAPGKKAQPIHHLRSTRMPLCEPYLQKLIKAFEKVHPGNGIREMLYDKRREKQALDIKVVIQYFYYLGKYPQLEQVVKAGYGAIVRDILQYSPQVVNKRIKQLFAEATNEKSIVGLPSFMREFIKTDKQMDDKRMMVLGRLYRTVPNMSREDFERYMAIFPHYLLATKKVLYFLNEGDYSFREICKLVSGYQRYGRKTELLRYQRDYIRMCRQMNIPFEKFPKDIVKLHNAVSAYYRARRDAVRTSAFAKKCSEYSDVNMSSEEYLIRIPHSLNELIYEGSTMHHCVASYADRVIAGSSIIFFMRKADKPDEPYITMEFDRQGSLVQARKSHNASIGNTEESKFIKQFQSSTLIPAIRNRAA